MTDFRHAFRASILLRYGLIDTLVKITLPLLSLSSSQPLSLQTLAALPTLHLFPLQLLFAMRRAFYPWEYALGISYCMWRYVRSRS